MESIVQVLKAAGFDLENGQTIDNVVESIQNRLVEIGFTIVDAASPATNKQSHTPDKGNDATAQRELEMEKGHTRIQLIAKSKSEQRTLGLELNVHSGFLGRKTHESDIWREIIHAVDPSYLVCDIDGMVFKSNNDYVQHLRMHNARGQGQMDEFAYEVQNTF